MFNLKMGGFVSLCHTYTSYTQLMKKMLIFTVIGLILFSNSFAQQIQLDSLDSQVHQLIKDFDIPGLSIAVVRNDSVIFSKVMET
jgi:hypothetical protein